MPISSEKIIIHSITVIIFVKHIHISIIRFKRFNQLFMSTVKVPGVIKPFIYLFIFLFFFFIFFFWRGDGGEGIDLITTSLLEWDDGSDCTSS